MKILGAASHASRARSIYYCHPLKGDSLDAFVAVCAQCKDIGFDHVAIAPPFKPGPSRDVFLAGDVTLAHPALSRIVNGPASGEEAAVEAVAERLAAVCHDQGLQLIVDVAIAQVDALGPLALSRPDLFGRDFDLPDPRARSVPPGAALAKVHASGAASELFELWAGRLGSLLNAGVDGFRFIDPGNAPPSFWIAFTKKLREAKPDSALLAVTPGMTWMNIEALGPARFDGVFCSLPWWDRRASWFAEELDLLRRVAPIVSVPEMPFGPRLADQLAYGVDPRVAYQQALDIAVATGDTVMIASGFEVASRQAMDRRDAPEYDAPAPEAGQIDLTASLRAALRSLERKGELGTLGATKRRADAGGGLTTLVRLDAESAARAGKAVALMINPNLDRPARRDFSLDPLPPFAGAPLGHPVPLDDRGEVPDEFAPGEVRLVMLERAGRVRQPETTLRSGLTRALQAPRIVIDNVKPTIDNGRYAVKRLAGEEIVVSADIFSDGHGIIAAELLWRAADQADWQASPMRQGENDSWSASFSPGRVGRHEFTIEAWLDEFASLSHDIAVKLRAGIDIGLDLHDANALLDAALKEAGGTPQLVEISSRLAAGRPQEAAELLTAPATVELVRKAAPRSFRVRREPAMPLEIERPQAGFSAWYELFPRSAAAVAGRHGTFDDVIQRLPAIRAMGFDVLYFPPIHPIGRTNRKGRNNSLVATPEDPGSPYAIGAADGGHTEIHAELGTFESFHRLIEAAASQGLEIALDFAIQCSPDHPWLKEHPDWFRWRRDGSLRFAENPPKKYEDIVNIDFYANGAARKIWSALRNVVLFWIEQGIRIFRVDNPHTKPLPFWEWLIADVRARHPDTIFLSEAFTRPKMMYRLAKVGFSQSYTYFTWRNDKRELTEYVNELVSSPVAEFFRPHFFVNTPDINPYFLQTSGRAGFLIRAALAATLSGLWGIYSGFELCEAAALPRREEYLDSEKYEIKHRSLDAPGNIVAEIATLNRIRRAHPALQSHLGVRFYNAYNDQILVYGKRRTPGASMILVAVNLDPHHVQEATFEVPLWEWGLADAASIGATDLISGRGMIWTGKLQHVRLDPNILPYAIWEIASLPGSRS